MSKPNFVDSLIQENVVVDLADQDDLGFFVTENVILNW